MIFDFTEYYNRLFIEPLIWIIFTTLIIVPSIILSYPGIRKNKFCIKEGLLLLLSTLVFSAILIVNLISFNPHLFTDKNKETRSEIGVITDIKIPDFSAKHFYDGHIVWGSIITIDDEEYYIMTIGEFEVSDEVVIEYLPNSKVVMSINYLED